MLDFIREGGVPSIVILVFAVAAIVSAGRFAWSPNERQLPGLRALNNVLLYTIVMGTLAGLHAVSVAASEAEGEQLVRILVVGCGEALTIGVLGFGVLSFVSILLAVGHRRMKA